MGPESKHVPRSLLLATIALVLASACSPAPRDPAPAEIALGHYEQIRAALAKDDASPLPETARSLARTASEAAANAPTATQPRFQELSTAAQELSAVPNSDMSALRLAFGEVSRAVVSLIVADETLASGRYIFRCPMAQGYKKWVQTSSELENPYMGSRMLHCGSETQWVE